MADLAFMPMVNAILTSSADQWTPFPSLLGLIPFANPYPLVSMNALEKLEQDPTVSEWLRKAAGEAQRLPAFVAVNETAMLARATLEAHNRLALDMAALPQNQPITAAEHKVFPHGRW